VATFQDEKARENLQDAIDDVPGDATLEEGVAAIRGQTLILATEINQISSISCKRR